MGRPAVSLINLTSVGQLKLALTDLFFLRQIMMSGRGPDYRSRRRSRSDSYFRAQLQPGQGLAEPEPDFKFDSAR